MAGSTSGASPGKGNHKALLAALLCIAAAAAAASFLPGSSAASTPLITQTCSKTSNQRLCVSLLESSNRSRTATTVQELAVVAVTAARRSVLRARVRMLDLIRSEQEAGARGAAPPPAPALASRQRRLVARCAALYQECLHAAALAIGRVKYMRAYDGRAAGAVAALRAFPARCQRGFDAQGVTPPAPLALLNRDTEQKLRVALEIVRLLRRQSPPSPPQSRLLPREW